MLTVPADVSANLKGKVSKPVAQKVLTDLAGETPSTLTQQSLPEYLTFEGIRGLFFTTSAYWDLTTNEKEKGLLTVKAYGKQTIFVYNQVSHFRTTHLLLVQQTPYDTQSRLNTASSDDIAELEEELRRTQKDLEERRNDLKTVSRGA